MKVLQTLIIFLISVYNSSAIDSTKVVYYQNDSVRLEMDIFSPGINSNVAKKPLFIYVHGGGFSSGNRSDGFAFCKYLAGKGFVAATISYTLYMKDKSFSCDGILSEKIKAIRYGVNDLWLATGYFIDHQKDFGIDTSKIFIGGCSAGAETVLHAAFWDYNHMNWNEDKLPETFKYKGIVSGAGALMDLNLITNKNLTSVMMFHGTCDNLVPFGTAAHHFCNTDASGWLMLFGSHSIYKHIVNMGGNVKLVSYCSGGHEYSNTLFESNFEIVYDFLENVISDQKFQHHSIIPTGKECNGPNEFNFCR